MMHVPLQRLFCVSVLLFASFPVAAACRYTEVAALPLHTPEANGAPVIDVRVNKAIVPMLADTGYRRTVLTKTEVDRQQLPLIHSKSLGFPDVLTAQPDDVQIGPVHANKSYFTVIDYPPMSGYSGIVGADYLLQADLEIALADKKMSLFKADDCYDKSLAYWDPQALEAPLERASDFPGGMVKVKLNGRTTWALIDTGSPYSLVSLEFARRVGVTPESAGTAGDGDFVKRNGETSPMWNASFDSFTIGDETISGPHIAITEMVQPYSYPIQGMVLGRDFLRSHRVLLAFGQDRMYFSYLGGQVFVAPN